MRSFGSLMRASVWSSPTAGGDQDRFRRRLRLGDGSGLDVIHALRAEHANARSVILTAYAAIATAVRAVKIGAFDYLPKTGKRRRRGRRPDGRAAPCAGRA